MSFGLANPGRIVLRGKNPLAKRPNPIVCTIKSSANDAHDLVNMLDRDVWETFSHQIEKVVVIDVVYCMNLTK